ncbi:MAG: peptide chain release factor 1 [Caldilinea sp.]|nr:peptide chain release factor 1 [Caldilineaceae bacterium]MCO5208854.1 peptide chain release factor 1 [Caldilinea sp.]MCW5840299.1 peptide chain release factor 1 [Caldilinea sp.]
MSNIIDRVAKIADRFDELTELMADPAVAADFSRLSEIDRERQEIEDLAATYRRFAVVESQLAENQLLLEDADAEMRELAELELESLSAEREELDQQMKALLLPKDPKDEKNVIVEIRAGTGGEEAGLFAAELYRMYLRWAEAHRYKTEELSLNDTGIGGLKEAVFAIKGKGAYSKLKYESGVHRVQRVPVTESAGRIHTSAATVAVLPEADEIDVEVNDNDIRIDIFRSSGPGGQSVNTTDSAVRLTHLPTGIVISCQDEKSQLQNKLKAMRILRSRLYEIEEQKRTDELGAARRSQIGSGDRSEKIRTYNFPQSRVTDHRINKTVYQLDAVMNGDLDEFIEELAAQDQAQRLEAMSAELA